MCYEKCLYSALVLKGSISVNIVCFIFVVEVISSVSLLVLYLEYL